MKLKAHFDLQYGFSVNIKDIESSFTIDDIGKRYQKIRVRLTIKRLVNI